MDAEKEQANTITTREAAQTPAEPKRKGTPAAILVTVAGIAVQLVAAQGGGGAPAAEAAVRGAFTAATLCALAALGLEWRRVVEGLACISLSGTALGLVGLTWCVQERPVAIVMTVLFVCFVVMMAGHEVYVAIKSIE